MRRIIILFFLFLLIGCSSQFPVKNSPVMKKMELNALPCWIYELPAEGDYVIGISTRSFDEFSMQESARQMAAIIRSRNKSSFTINKFARTSGSDNLKEGNTLFQLNVAEPEKTRKVFENLKLIDETFLFDNYIALFSETENSIDESYCKKQVMNFPQWFKEDKLTVTDTEILSCSKAGSYNLATAWEKAAEKARFQLAEYLEKDVQSSVISNNEVIEKQIAIESTRKLIDISIPRSFIILKNIDSLISYEVYLELRMNK
jgi:hypothetical protein